MPRAVRRVVGGLGVASALLGLLTLALAALGPSVPSTAEPVFEIDDLRAMAGREGPTSIRAARVSGGVMRGVVARLGGDWALRPTGAYVVEATSSWGTVIIDPATDADCAEDYLGVASYDPAAYGRMQQALRRASAIVATHEHYDHLCGLTRSPYLDEVMHAVRLTPAQLTADTRMGVAKELVDLVEPFALDGMRRVAPGVVMIEAPGHTEGSLWVYVRQRDGQEWLFVGDTVWSEDALEDARGKPWLSIFMVGEDWRRQGPLVRFLSDFRRTHPEVRIAVAHEDARWEAWLQSGALLPL